MLDLSAAFMYQRREESCLVVDMTLQYGTLRSGARQISENICSEVDLRSRIFGTFVVKFLACPGGGNSHMKQTGMLVVSLRGVNFGFWSRLGCSGQSANILSRQGLV